jgi:hypothetical protein
VPSNHLNSRCAANSLAPAGHLGPKALAMMSHEGGFACGERLAPNHPPANENSSIFGASPPWKWRTQRPPDVDPSGAGGGDVSDDCKRKNAAGGVARTRQCLGALKGGAQGVRGG